MSEDVLTFWWIYQQLKNNKEEQTQPDYNWSFQILHYTAPPNPCCLCYATIDMQTKNHKGMVLHAICLQVGSNIVINILAPHAFFGLNCLLWEISLCKCKRTSHKICKNVVNNLWCMCKITSQHKDQICHTHRVYYPTSSSDMGLTEACTRLKHLLCSHFYYTRISVCSEIKSL